MRKITVLLAIALAASWAGFASGASAQYAQSLNCSFTAVESGGTIEAVGDGFMPGSDVTISVTNGGDIIVVETVTADLNGVFEFSLTIPPDAPNGTYGIVAEGIDAQGEAVRSLSCNVIDPQVDGITEVPEVGGITQENTVEPLAFTGSNSKPMIQIALGAISLGGLLVFVGRRRRYDDAAHHAA